MGETFHFEDLPDRHLRLWLFKEVENTSVLLQKLQEKSVEPECSFINANLVADHWLILAAAFKALVDEESGKLKTHSLHGELVFNLSGSRHIGESFKQYGLSESVSNILVGRFDATDDQEHEICSMIDGKLRPISSLPDYTDTRLIEKHLHWSQAEQELKDLSGSIITRMAVRDC